MIRRRSHPDATVSTRRLEAFTDGVFAIAATLLVLDLTSYDLGELPDDAALWSALGGMSELFLNFALSFVLLCLLWMTHVTQFEFLSRVDGVMVWLNNIRLLCIVLVPFATGLVTEHSDLLAARLAMPVTFFGAILMAWLQWLWTVRRRQELMPDRDHADVVSDGRGALSAVLIGALVVILSPWIGSFAFLLFLLDGPVTRLLRRSVADAEPSTSS